MSLRSGFASLATSASKIGRLVFGGGTNEETSEDEGTDAVSSSGESDNGDVSDGGDSVNDVPKDEGPEGSSAGDASGYGSILLKKVHLKVNMMTK